MTKPGPNATTRPARTLRWLKDRLRPWFYRYYECLHPVRAIEWRALSNKLKLVSGQRVLDIGTGHGHFIARSWRPGVRMVGIDLSVSGIDCARRFNRPPGCAYVRGDAMHLPFEDAAFDVLMSVCAWEHFADDMMAFSEAARVIKPGGRFVLSVDSLTYRGISSSYRECCRRRHGVAHFYRPATLKRRLTDAGFEIRSMHFVGRTPVFSFAYKASSFFRWRGIDAMDPALFLLTFPAAVVFEEWLGLGPKEEGYILVAETLKA